MNYVHGNSIKKALHVTVKKKRKEHEPSEKGLLPHFK